MSKILVTGAGGYIGSFVVGRLSVLHDVYGVVRRYDDKSSFRAKWIKENLATTDCSAQLPHDVDCVVHLAQSKEYRDFPSGSEDMRRVNIDATCKLLEWARKTGVQQFIFTSTANVYRKSTGLLTEAHPTEPESFYGASKLSAEHLIWQYRDFFQVDILRLFTVYGPSQNGMLIPNIIDKILTGKPITLAEGEGFFLSPIFVADVVDVIQRLIADPSRRIARLMNVCGDQVCSLSEIVKILEQVIGKSAIIQMTDEEARSFTGSNQRLKNYLGGVQFVDIETGLGRVAESGKMLH